MVEALNTPSSIIKIPNDRKKKKKKKLHLPQQISKYKNQNTPNPKYIYKSTIYK